MQATAKTIKPATAKATTTSSAATDNKIQALEKRVKALETRLARLEKLSSKSGSALEARLARLEEDAEYLTDVEADAVPSNNEEEEEEQDEEDEDEIKEQTATLSCQLHKTATQLTLLKLSRTVMTSPTPHQTQTTGVRWSLKKSLSRMFML